MSIDERTDLDAIGPMVDGLRHSFSTGRTRPIEWRKAQLQGLLRVLNDGGDRLVEAMGQDFGKPPIEAFAADIAFTRTEVSHTLKHLSSWMAPQKVKLPLNVRPAKGYIIPEPLGVSLIIAPWNYPVQLLLSPMAISLAAGNAVVAKPSELTPNTSRVMAQLLRENLDPEAVAVIEGGVDVSSALLEQRWDHIFFTGSTAVGKIVAAAAAKHLTPTVLELGGKSPTIIAPDANLDVAARRVAWGKWLNAGQTCIAPDYVLVHRKVKDEFVDKLVSTIAEFYGPDPASSPDLARIVNDRHITRLSGLLNDHGGEIATGGRVLPTTRALAPTVVVDPDPDSAMMREEIFGPILPIITVDDIEEAIAFINGRAKPLALYAFTENDKTADRIIAGTSSGGVGINQTVLHIAPPELPFGGVGESGNGRYHGQRGFEALSNMKPVLHKPTRGDVKVLYPPYTGFKKALLKRFA